MANKYKQRNYKCSCGAELKEYVWDSDLEKSEFVCTQCESKITAKNLVTETKQQLTAIRTDTKNR